MKTTNFKNQKPIVENDNMNKKPKKEAFSYSIYNKDNFKEFCELEECENVKIISRNDLPSEFNEELCNFINLFIRKMVNEKTEWNFYIDYETNEIIHCLHGQETNVTDYIHYGLMKSKKIMTIHNHPKGTYSTPSYKNFEILNHPFEDYEFICGTKELWILEAKGEFNNDWICDIKKEIYRIFKKCDTLEGIQNEEKNLVDSEKLYENELKIFINNLKSNIRLIKREYKS